jgi:S-adenosylmethionine hydrolase
VARPVIALLTDFGTRDHYVGAMRGVALGICPDATLTDITHEIEPQDVLGGALELAAAFPYFPDHTIFLSVVDPGVGSARRAIAAEVGGYRFVAPDNGLLTQVFRVAPPSKVVEIIEPRYARSAVSRTFEGRDRFAPAAAWLATGLSVDALGPPMASWHVLDIPAPVRHEETLSGIVLRVDRFGNLATNIDRPTFDSLVGGGSFEIVLAGHAMRDLVATYSESVPDAICALFDSSDRLEVAVSGGSAARRLGIGRGAPITVARR